MTDSRKPALIMRRKSNGELYESHAPEVGTAHCPDCLKHFEDCRCTRGTKFSGQRSKTKPDLSQLDKFT